MKPWQTYLLVAAACVFVGYTAVFVAQQRDLIARGVIDKGMIPKVEAALASLEAGVGKVHIIDGRLRHSLLLEMYTDHGIGTEIVLEQADHRPEPRHPQTVRT